MTPKEIRQEIVTRLTGNTSVGNRVSSQRIDPVKIDTGQAQIVVFTTSRNAENKDHEAAAFVVDVQVEVDCIVPNNSTWADDVDDLLEEVKALLFGDPTFWETFEDTMGIPGYTEEISLVKEAEYKLATGALTFNVQAWQEY